VGFKEIQSAPSIDAVSTNSSVSTIDAKVTLLSNDGTVYCGAFTSSSTPSSDVDIQLQNYLGSTINNVTTISLTGLMPSTSYGLYCYSVSSIGVQTTFSTVLKQRANLMVKLKQRANQAVEYVALAAGKMSAELP
jgi:hypothetical protein